MGEHRRETSSQCGGYSASFNRKVWGECKFMVKVQSVKVTPWTWGPDTAGSSVGHLTCFVTAGASSCCGKTQMLLKNRFIRVVSEWWMIWFIVIISVLYVGISGNVSVLHFSHHFITRAYWNQTAVSFFHTYSLHVRHLPLMSAVSVNANGDSWTWKKWIYSKHHGRFTMPNVIWNWNEVWKGNNCVLCHLAWPMSTYNSIFFLSCSFIWWIILKNNTEQFYLD